MSLAAYRPRSVAEIVDATFTFYRDNAAAIITVAMLIVAPPAILKAVVPDWFGQIVEFAGNFIVPIGQGAIAALVAAAVERDETLDSGAALRSTSGRVGSLIAAQIASGLMVFIGLVLLVVPGFIALIWTAVCIPVVMIERVGYSAAIDRSRTLARGSWGHVLGTLVLSWGLAFLLVLGAAFLGGMFGVKDGVTDLVSEILFGLVIPIPAIAMTFLYYDLRVRSESADLDAMISALPTATPTSGS